MPRDVLPQRRGGETVQFRHWNMDFCAITGHYDDGRIGEVFMSAGKLTSATDIAIKEAAIAVSFALQFGATLDDMRRAMPRKTPVNKDDIGEPEGPLGKLMDLLEQKP